MKPQILRAAIISILSISYDATALSIQGDSAAINRDAFYREQEPPGDDKKTVNKSSSELDPSLQLTPHQDVSPPDDGQQPEAIENNDDESNDSTDEHLEQTVQLDNCFSRFNVDNKMSSGIDIFLFDESSRVERSLKELIFSQIDKKSKNKLIIVLSYSQSNVSARFIGYNIKPVEPSRDESNDSRLFDKCLVDNSRVFKYQINSAITSIPYNEETNVNQKKQIIKAIDFLPMNKEKLSFFWVSSGYDEKIIELINDGKIDYGTVLSSEQPDANERRSFQFYWIHGGDKYVPEYKKSPGLIKEYFKSVIEKKGGEFHDERSTNKSRSLEEGR